MLAGEYCRPMGCKPLEKPKRRHRKGLWSPEEDQRLKNYIVQYGHSCWSSVPVKAGLQRNGKSCRLRWINYLRPGLKHGLFTLQEEETVLALHRLLGNKWSKMAQHLPGRTDNEIKNYWNSYLKKKVMKAEGLVDQINTQNINSAYNIPTSEEPQTHVRSFELSENMERSSTDTDQSVTHVFNCHPPKETFQSSFPKLLFAEWLSLDYGHGPNLSSAVPVVPRENSDHLNLEDAFRHGFLHNEQFASEFHHGLSSGETDKFPSQFMFESQIPESGFFDFVSVGEMYTGFNMTNDEIN
ncbi:hypothetical protein HHK36_027758 [Tetracentron sinense]|uniref:Uncharacterized protein n=1 Tax=Tetracentron sinense TaxID=13715 RepID=A0A835D3U6_TETSI|nr:hypothetical protein HHK36_027758 [Tetracentron sinense]